MGSSITEEVEKPASCSSVESKSVLGCNVTSLHRRSLRSRPAARAKPWCGSSAVTGGGGGGSSFLCTSVGFIGDVGLARRIVLLALGAAVRACSARNRRRRSSETR
eukprot:4280495-Pleurochrysis_carterae.AAC.1